MAEVSTTAFDDWRRKQQGAPTEAEAEEARLVAAIREIHDESDATYGQPRMTAELRAQGLEVNHERVERLMRIHAIVGVHKPAKVRTTIQPRTPRPCRT